MRRFSIEDCELSDQELEKFLEQKMGAMPDVPVTMTEIQYVKNLRRRWRAEMRRAKADRRQLRILKMREEAKGLRRDLLYLLGVEEAVS